MPDDLDDVRALLPGKRIEHVDQLGGSSRSRVSRIRADDDTLIVKRYNGSGPAWARESAALSVLPTGVPAPRLVAAAPPIVIMTDAGPGGSVADALLGPDPSAAADAMLAWASTIASLHLSTAGSADPFAHALAVRAENADLPAGSTPAELDGAAASLASICASLDVAVPSAALDELRDLPARFSAEAPQALTPGDPCPDNNVFTGNDLTLIDFEFAEWRPVAWDAAYLEVPWPSCWCAWRVPAAVASLAMDAYRTRAGTPYVESPAFRRDVAVASIGLVFASMEWLLPRALRYEPTDAAPKRPMPAPRPLVLHRLRQAAESTELPALADLAARLHHTLTAGWGTIPLPYAPAFADA
jgi:hypothetical protein